MLRRFRRDRLFYGAVVLLLALGIGSNTLVFSLVNELLLKPLPVRDPDNLYLLEANRRVQVRPDTMFYYPGLTEGVQKNPLVAAAVAEQSAYSPAMVPFRQGDTARLVPVQMVSPNYFHELGIHAYAGRVLDESDAKASGTLAAVLSYQFWQSQFGGDREIVGRTIRLKDVPFTVAGILPREFHSADIDSAPDVRVPISAEVPLFGLHTWPTFEILVRLRPGVSPERAAASLEPIFGPLDDRIAHEQNAQSKHPVSEAQLQERMRLWRTEELHHALAPVARGVSQMRNQFSRALWVLVGGVALLLLAVCANVAGLLLARAGERRKEIGIRLAIGAGRRHIIRQMLVESLVLAVAGAGLGAAFAWVAIPPLLRLLPPVRGLHQFSSPQILAVTPDFRVLAFAAGIMAFSVLVSALIPAWRASRVDLLSELKSQQAGERAVAAGIVPLALQVVFCTVLLSAAVLAARTFRNLQHLDPGFDRDHVVSFTFDPTDAGYTPEQAGAFYRDLRDRAAELPGVRAAAYSWTGVMRGIGMKTTIAPEGVTLPKSTFLNTSAHEVTADYFQTMGIPLLAGRNLTRADKGGLLDATARQVASPTPVVVNRAFADFFFPHQNPIGKRLVQGTDGKKPPTHVIVGMVGNAKYRSLREDDPPTLYTPMGDEAAPNGPYILYVRTYGSPASMTAAMRQTAAALGAGVPLVESFTLDQEVQDSLWQERLVAILATFFGVTSVLLAAIGLYTALARSVARRTRELGIRIAIGAQIRHIVGTVGAPLAWAIACGLAGGFTASAALLRLTRALLYGVDPVDPVSYAAAALLILACAGLGAAVPVVRALRIDPAAALRSE
jgi:predicted permease